MTLFTRLVRNRVKLNRLELLWERKEVWSDDQHEVASSPLGGIGGPPIPPALSEPKVGAARMAEGIQ